jgi:hypothetical protein
MPMVTSSIVAGARAASIPAMWRSTPAAGMGIIITPVAERSKPMVGAGTVAGHLRIDALVQKPPEGLTSLGIETGLGHGVHDVLHLFDLRHIVAQHVLDLR